MRRTCYMLIVVAAMAGLMTAQVVPDPRRYAELTDRIFFYGGVGQASPETFQFPPKEEMDRITKELHDMVTAAVEQPLSVRTQSAESLREAILRIQGTFIGWKEPDSNLPFAEFTDLNGLPVLVVAFTVIRGGAGVPDNQAYLRFYSHAGGEWKVRGEVGSEFNGTMMKIEQVKAPVPGEVWYLGYGRIVGSTCGAGKAAVYAFDGYTVRTLLQRDAECNLVTEVSADKVVIGYLVKEHKENVRTITSVGEVFRVTGSGLVLESRTERVDEVQPF